MRRASAALLLLAFAATAALALQPDEILKDPALEARARALSQELRCMVCQNQSIDDSDADLARDLRVLVRERLSAGDTDDQVLDYVVARYGEFVLLKPRINLRNAVLWGAPILLLLVGAAAVWRAAAGRRAAPETALSEEEASRIERLLAEDPASAEEPRK
ncbi:MAG: cytochrome c-type biogenesis protein CcmH [Rhizobiaceae bacterium]|nr:cytochrome c-type biogenesis protein CcmH [Rhizobiaceae bacterium]